MAEEKIPVQNPQLVKVLKENSVDVTHERAKIPLATVRRIMAEEGIVMIRNSALIEMRNIVEDMLRSVSRESLVYLNHRKARMVTKEDILMAIR